jgi:adenosylcobyric acid synthase
MNPILLKPSSDVGSQVIVNGAARAHMSAADYFAYKTQLIPDVRTAYESLASEYDVIVIEGAGSPAEINLRENDIVNMGLAELVDAPVLLAGDIDRGGVFAQLYGTVALLTEAERARVRGLIVNKFRGDAALLGPGLRQIERMTGIPVLGVVPYLRVEIDDEDSLAPRLERTGARKPIDIAVIRLPHISNFTDFAPLDVHPLLGVRYVDRTDALGEPDLVILPGTKSTMDDLLRIRKNGLEESILRLVSRGVPVLGVCGGYQMLGERIDDAAGVEGGAVSLRGMGLLPCVTSFAPSKTLTRVRATVMDGALRGAALDAYEIHMGATEAHGGAPFCILDGGAPEGCRAGNVCGTYLHGLFDSGEAVDKLAEWLCARKGIQTESAPVETWGAYKERQYDLLAEGVRAALDMDAVYRILEGT